MRPAVSQSFHRDGRTLERAAPSPEELLTGTVVPLRTGVNGTVVTVVRATRWARKFDTHNSSMNFQVHWKPTENKRRRAGLSFSTGRALSPPERAGAGEGCNSSMRGGPNERPAKIELKQIP